MTLAKWMARHSKSRTDVALALGVSTVSVSRYLNGSRLPKPDIMRAIKKMTDGAVTADDFLDEMTTNAA